MSIALTNTRSLLGINAKSVAVEVHLSNGLPRFNLVGLPETAVKESKDRVRSAIINSQFEFPCRRITVNLAPADLPKAGCGFDLPIALGILAASGQIPIQQLHSHEFIGELALNGNLRGVPAIIPTIIAANNEKKYLIFPADNAQEAGLTTCKNIFFAYNLREVCNYLHTQQPLHHVIPHNETNHYIDDRDWSDIKGQQHAKYAMNIAACGSHSILLYGSPGSGKTMLAKYFDTLLPDLTEQQALESIAIHSLSGRITNFNTWRKPIIRSPHHTASQIALVGGGNPPKPGEISLAHNGVLFLDELPEFHRNALETLREPLESGTICISRATIQTEFPAKFQLIAAMNPCPCGHFGNPNNTCMCSPERINKYLSKISGPLLDRIDLQINVQPLSQDEFLNKDIIETNQSIKIKTQVQQLKELQLARQGCLNARLNTKQTEAVCHLDEHAKNFLHQIMHKLKFSARSYYRLLKIARTIADMQDIKIVSLPHLQLALTFKQSINMPK